MLAAADRTRPHVERLLGLTRPAAGLHEPYCQRAAPTARSAVIRHCGEGSARGPFGLSFGLAGAGSTSPTRSLRGKEGSGYSSGIFQSIRVDGAGWRSQSRIGHASSVVDPIAIDIFPTARHHQHLHLLITSPPVDHRHHALRRPPSRRPRSRRAPRR
ncbi:40S ribosomal protein S11, partial [Moesziomyces antarcticus T-34]